MATESLGRQKIGEGIAVVVLVGFAIVAAATGEVGTLVDQTLAATRQLEGFDFGLVVASTVVALSGAAWASRRTEENAALLGATATIPALVGAVLGTFRIAPASLEASPSPDLAADLALLGGVWARAGLLWGIACLGTALCFVAVAWLYALESRRRRLGAVAPAWDQLLGATVGLFIIEVAGRQLFAERIGPAGLDHLQVVLAAAAGTLAAAHVGRGASRGSDLVAAWAAVGVTLATAVSMALLDPALSATFDSPLEWLVKTKGMIARQRAMVSAGALFLAPVVLTLAIASIGASRIAIRRAVRSMGYGLLLLGTAIAAMAVVLPELRQPIAGQWRARLPSNLELAAMDVEPTSCGAPSLDTILFVQPERLRLGSRDLGPATRLDDPASCRRLADELPGGTSFAFDRRVEGPRLTCLFQALAPRTCSLRWVGARSRSPATPGCVDVELAGGHCSTDGAGPFVYLLGDGRVQVVGSSGVIDRTSAGVIAVALTSGAGGRVALSPSASAADVVALAGDVQHLTTRDGGDAPFRLAIPEPEATTPPPMEEVLPFRSTVDVKLSPEPDPPPPGLERRTDRLRRCEMRPQGWPPTVLRGRHILRFDGAGRLVEVWRTGLEPQVGASACVRRGLAKVPFPTLHDQLATLEVEVRSQLPRVEMMRYEGLEGEAETAFIALRDQLLEIRPAVDACYLDALERDPATKGSFPLQLVGDERGYVDVPFLTEAAPSAVASCIVSRLRQLRWPDPGPDRLDVVLELALPE